MKFTQTTNTNLTVNIHIGFRLSAIDMMVYYTDISEESLNEDDMLGNLRKISTKSIIRIVKNCIVRYGAEIPYNRVSTATHSKYYLQKAVDIITNKLNQV